MRLRNVLSKLLCGCLATSMLSTSVVAPVFAAGTGAGNRAASSEEAQAEMPDFDAAVSGAALIPDGEDEAAEESFEIASAANAESRQRRERGGALAAESIRGDGDVTEEAAEQVTVSFSVKGNGYLKYRTAEGGEWQEFRPTTENAELEISIPSGLKLDRAPVKTATDDNENYLLLYWELWSDTENEWQKLSKLKQYPNTLELVSGMRLRAVFSSMADQGYLYIKPIEKKDDAELTEEMLFAAVYNESKRQDIRSFRFDQKLVKKGLLADGEVEKTVSLPVTVVYKDFSTDGKTVKIHITPGEKQAEPELPKPDPGQDAEELLGFESAFAMRQTGEDKILPNFTLRWLTPKKVDYYRVTVNRTVEEKFIPTEKGRNFEGQNTIFNTLFDSDFNFELKDSEQRFPVRVEAYLGTECIAKIEKELVAPERAKIESITVNGDPIEREMQFHAPLEVQLKLNAELMKKSAENHITLEHGENKIRTELEFGEKSVTLRPIEALRQGERYTLKIGSWLRTEDQRSFLEKEESYILEVKKEAHAESLKLAQLLVNNDPGKDLLKTPDYKLQTGDTGLSLYFNQPVSFEHLEEGDVSFQGKGIWLSKKGAGINDTTRLMGGELFLRELDGKQVSCVSFQMAGKAAHVESQVEPLDANSCYILHIDEKIVSAAGQPIEGGFTKEICTGAVAAKSYTMEIGNAEFIEPASKELKQQIPAGARVRIRAAKKEGQEFIAWYLSALLQEEAPETYQELLRQQSNPELSFTMPKTDLYLSPDYRKPQGGGQETEQKEQTELEKFLQEKNVIPGAEVLERRAAAEGLEVLLLKKRYLLLQKAETVCGLSVNAEGMLFGFATVADWKAGELKREIRIPVQLKQTEAALEISDDLLNGGEGDLAVPLRLYVPVTILRDENRNGRADLSEQGGKTNAERIAEIKEQIQFRQLTLKENQPVPEHEEEVLSVLKLPRNVELIAAPETCGLSLSADGNISGVPDVVDWNAGERIRVITIPVVLEIISGNEAEAGLSFRYPVTVVIERGELNRANVLISEDVANRLAVYGIVMDGQAIFQPESAAWYDAVYKGNAKVQRLVGKEWQELPKSEYSFNPAAKTITFAGRLLKTGDLLRIAVQNYEDIWMKLVNPEDHRDSEGNIPPVALYLLDENPLTGQQGEKPVPKPEKKEPEKKPAPKPEKKPDGGSAGSSGGTHSRHNRRGSGGGGGGHAATANQSTAGSQLRVLPDTSGSWVKNPEGGWKFTDPLGQVYRNWWIVSGNRWYYAGNDGNLLYGWQFIGGRWYYFSKYLLNGNPQGALLTSTVTPDGYLVDENGRWN